MTLIYAIGNQFWIEVFHIARASLANGIKREDAITLERQGQFLGGSLVVDMNTNVVNEARDVVAMLTLTGGGELTIGADITALEIALFNGTATTADIGETAVIFMRGTGK